MTPIDVPFAGTNLSRPSGTTPIPSIPLRKFHDSLGINVHMEYTDGLYANSTQVLADLRYLGIHNVRDGVTNYNIAAQEFLAANGIKFDLISNANASLENTTRPILDSFVGLTPGSLSFIEGPNEINNWPVSGVATNQENAIAFQTSLFSAIHNDPRLLGSEVLYFTGGSQVSVDSLSHRADLPNAHPYPQGGQQPYTWLNSGFVASYTDDTAYAKAITETGYSTVLQGNYNGVDEVTQAQLVLNSVFDAALLGSLHTYLYQLLEAYPNFATNSDTGYGLFRFTDGKPKLAAVTLHNLQSFLPRDLTSSQQSVYGTVAGLASSTGKIFGLTSSDGTVYLALWNEVNVWNPQTQTSVPAGEGKVNVSLPGPWQVESFDPVSGSVIAQLSPNANGSFSLPIASHVVIFAFHPAH